MFYRVGRVLRRLTLDKRYPELKLKEARMAAGKLFEAVCHAWDNDARHPQI